MRIMVIIFVATCLSFVEAAFSAEPVKSQAELESIAESYVADLAKLDPLFASDCGALFQSQTIEIGRIYQKDGGLDESAPISAKELEFIAISWFAFEGAAIENVKFHPYWLAAREKNTDDKKSGSTLEVFSCDRLDKSPDGRTSKWDQFNCESNVAASEAIINELVNSCSAVARAMFTEGVLPIDVNGFPEGFYSEFAKP